MKYIKSRKSDTNLDFIFDQIFRECNNTFGHQCGEFSHQLLKKLGGETNETFIINPFDDDSKDHESMNYDDPTDKRYYKNFGVIPKSIPIGEFKLIDHVWLYHKGRQYDSFTPQGVTNFMDLGWFKDNIDEIVNDPSFGISLEEWNNGKRNI